MCAQGAQFVVGNPSKAGSAAWAPDASHSDIHYDENEKTRRAGSVASGDDAPKLASIFGISRNRLACFKVQIALDVKAEFAADRLQFDEAHIGELRGPVVGPSPCACLRAVQNGPCRFSR